ncbi:MAG: ATP-dependent RecD-like DNA helicase, partial [Patescibacteria group bacterium]|nr:ATP-dependent RecD-like DNA helicase [Patescibacteria group bacterium]
NFNLMEKPYLRLEEIHRQAKENPIIKLSVLAREQGTIPTGSFGPRVAKLKKEDSEVAELLQNYNENTLVLCGYNSTRIKLNQFIRDSLGFDSPEPGVSDRVICLRNNHAKEIFNGMLGYLRKIKKRDEDWYKAEIDMDEEINLYKGLISVKQFGSQQPLNFTQKRREIMQGDLFDFGYALTVHKAQGSQARRVILFEERFPKMTDEEWRRWLYTGVTRAEEELYLIF